MISIKISGIELLEKAGQKMIGAKNDLMQSLFRESRIFGDNAVRIAKNKYLRGPRPTNIMSEGKLKANINTKTEQDGNIINTSIGSDVIYAAIQELGGTTHPTLTQRMRKFAWYKFYETKDEKWKRIALSKKERLTVKIPARPYLRPAIEDALPDFQKNIEFVLSKLSFTD